MTFRQKYIFRKIETYISTDIGSMVSFGEVREPVCTPSQVPTAAFPFLLQD